MNRKKNGPGLGRRWRILRNLGITALLGVALWASRGFPLPTAELRFEWAQRGALMADPAPLQGQVGSELVGANGRDIVVYSEGSWKIRTFPRTPGPALVPLSDGVVAVDVPEGTASARLVMTLSLYYEELPGGICMRGGIGTAVCGREKIGTASHNFWRGPMRSRGNRWRLAASFSL